jgi:hypothetical protein
MDLSLDLYFSNNGFLVGSISFKFTVWKLSAVFLLLTKSVSFPAALLEILCCFVCNGLCLHVEVFPECLLVHYNYCGYSVNWNPLVNCAPLWQVKMWSCWFWWNLVVLGILYHPLTSRSQELHPSQWMYTNMALVQRAQVLCSTAIMSFDRFVSLLYVLSFSWLSLKLSWSIFEQPTEIMHSLAAYGCCHCGGKFSHFKLCSYSCPSSLFEQTPLCIFYLVMWFHYYQKAIPPHGCLGTMMNIAERLDAEFDSMLTVMQFGLER